MPADPIEHYAEVLMGQGVIRIKFYHSSVLALRSNIIIVIKDQNKSEGIVRFGQIVVHGKGFKGCFSRFRQRLLCRCAAVVGKQRITIRKSGVTERVIRIFFYSLLKV